MILGLIFSILTATYTLSSTTTVDCSGTAPAGSRCFYERSASTGQKGQMTAGNATCLSLQGWDGCRLRGLTLKMHSNQNKGTGSLTVRVGGKVVWQISNKPFSSNEWAGQYSTNWVDVSKTLDVLVGDGEQVEVVISATESSLYINSYEFRYEAPAPKCYKVDFVTGLDSVCGGLVQSQVGEILVLPNWCDTAHWSFLGWSETEVLDDTWSGEYLEPGSGYVPQKDMVLWAVYSDMDSWCSSDVGVDGSYVLAGSNAYTEGVSGGGMAMMGMVQQGTIGLCSVDMYESAGGGWCMDGTWQGDAVYWLDFGVDSTLYISHSVSGSSVGYKDGSLCAVASEWRYRVLSDGSLGIYCELGDGVVGALYFGEKGGGSAAYLQRINGLYRWKEGGLWLFPVVSAEYTSWPFGKWDAVDNVKFTPGLSAEYIMYIGGYKVYIKDGKKWINL